MGQSSRVAVSLLYLSQMFGSIVTQREHKVHNIVLYPHKHSWCKMTEIKQVVAHPGCDSIEVENNVCVGGCFSYSIPLTIPSSPGEVAPYCDSCQPSTHSWRQVVLNCSSGDTGRKALSKMVQIIENCTCAKCSNQAADLLDEDVPLEEDPQLPEKPQLMDILDTTPERYGNYTILSNSSQGNDPLVSHRTMVLLEELSDGDGEDVEMAEDHVALREILHHVEGNDHKINGAILKDFVRRVEEHGHININVKRLQKVLEKLEHSENKNNGHRHQHMAGPHHSLVLPREPDLTPEAYLKPTLDVPSELLTPAHEGLELSYHNNIVPSDTADDLGTDSK